MSDREEREKVIAVLLDMYRWMDGAQYIVATRERIHAIAYAIASIKTDLKYDLMYEEALDQEPTTKNDLGVDCISKQAVLNKILKFSVTDGRSVSVTSLWTEVNELPLVPPQEPQSFKWCDTCKEYDQEKHCCHRYSKVIRDTVAEIEQEPRWIPVSERLPASNQLNSISISKNDLGVDLISREQAKTAIRDKFKDLPSRVEINTILNELPPATLQEPRWIPVSERLPKDLEPVNITWVNRNPESYYANIKDKPFTATGVYFNGQWYWWSTLCTDMLAEYSHNYDDIIDDDIEITAWQPLPQPFEPQ